MRKVNRSLWKAGLVDAVEPDESEIEAILDLQTDNEIEADDGLSEQFGQTESCAEDEERELSDEVRFINGGVHQIDIESQPRKLK